MAWFVAATVSNLNLLKLFRSALLLENELQLFIYIL